jgi:GNAT superfamily N-acetyltransferase
MVTAAVSRVASIAFALRPGAQEDEGFVYSTWLKNFKYSSRFANRIPDTVYFAAHKRLIEAAVARSHVLVAVDPAAPLVIYGYAVAEPGRDLVPGCLHFLFVKARWRKLGVGRALVEAIRPAPCQFSHWTYEWDTFGLRYPDMRYNPYRALAGGNDAGSTQC